MLTKKITWILALLVVPLMGLALMEWRSHDTGPHTLNIALLVSNDVALDGPSVEVWRDAANEAGLQLEAVHVRDWVRDFTRNDVKGEGVILPDTSHRRMDEGTKEALGRYVEAGGRLMVVYDAGTLNEKGFYRVGGAGLSRLVGMRYALYATLRDKVVQMGGPVVGSAATLERIGIPPGRYQGQREKEASEAPALNDKSNNAIEAVVSYAAGQQVFASWVTQGRPSEPILLQNELGHVVASRHRTGKGETLFVNLPLAYLKQQSDGAFLHGFLRYFATYMLLQPWLAETPGALGVPILNWHVDALPALPSMKQLTELGLFETEGPFSFHITAGPDVNVPGDKGGLDLDNNAEVREIFLALFRRGHAIASHGGWIHNYFGRNADETNQESMEPLLDKNHESIVALTGVEPKEYSAPQGNQPQWANKWLESKGVISTYLTGNIGMGPTRRWKGDARASGLWTFPVLTMGTVATAEDARYEGISQEAFEGWLQDVARFLESEGTMRLVYFHPPGAMLYPTAVRNFVNRIGECRRAGRCRWMTMTQAAEFMNRREKTVWRFQRDADHWVLNASNQQDLAELTWRFPKKRFARPTAINGNARLQELGDDWLLIAGQGTKLVVEVQEAL